MLEEIGFEYAIKPIDITRGEQFAPRFLAINPNGKIPAIVDWNGPGDQPISLFESGAILLYLAEKANKLLPGDPSKRIEVLTWVFWQIGNQGPMLGQAAHFQSHAKSRGIQSEYALERYGREAHRVYGILEARLASREFIVDEYSIADVACFPWTRVSRGQGVDIEKYPNVKRWSDQIAERPAAQRRPEFENTGHASSVGVYSDEQWAVLFGALAPQNNAARLTLSDVERTNPRKEGT